MQRVLLYVPTYADALLPETVASVEAQVFDGTLTVEYGQHNVGETARERILANQRNARRMVLDGDYDALMFVEHDMSIPANAVQRLADTDAPVVYGVYLFRHRSYMLNAFRYENDRNLGMSLMNYPDDLATAREAGIWPVSGTGFGCTFIRRDVLKQIDFRCGEDGPHADMIFSRDCLQAGIRQVARFDVPCLHYCPEAGKWLNPEGDALGTLTEVEALQAVNIAPRGVLHRLEVGKRYELPTDTVGDYVRAGFVVVIEPPKSKAAPKRKRTTKAKATK
jgi:hypothetical protein